MGTDPRTANRPGVFVACGLQGSGSTWMYNLAQEICRAADTDFVACYRDWAANLPRDALGSRLVVVKSHHPMADFQSLIADPGELHVVPVMTVRDPRDAVASVQLRFQRSLDAAFKDVVASARVLVDLSRKADIPVFRYEDGFVGTVATFDRIAGLLGISHSEDQRAAILAKLAPEAVNTRIRELESTGVIRGEAAWDPETQWHANHVGDGKIGKFASALTSAQQQEILSQTADFCAHFGYGQTGKTPQDEGPIAATVGGSIAAAGGRPVFKHERAAADLGAYCMKTIGLCMIVKNESKVIRRCLANVLPLIDYVLVVDTGSTDGTQQIIRDFLAEHGVRGAVIDERWRDFAYNRSFALKRLRDVTDIDYALIIDADDQLVLEDGFDPRAFKSQMEHDFYDVQVRHGSITHYRPQLCSNRLAFVFKGVVHEYLEVPPGQLTRATASGFHIGISGGGARSENPQKFQDDAALLERTLATETDPFLISRYTFYLAQSYRDCGEHEKAVANYLKRAELGFWNEEIYVSLLEAGKLMESLKRPFEEVTATYERANQMVPGRAEALHAASLYCRNNGRNAEGMEFARRGMELPQPGGLFVQPWVYDYGVLDEFAINAYWAGAYRESLDASLKLLAGGKLPGSMVQRVAANARFAADKLPKHEPPNLGALGAESLIDQHKLGPARALHSRLHGAPRVMVAILAKQKEPALPFYLQCIEALDYPKSSIVLYIRTNNNTDRTERTLREWMARVGHLYAAVEFDASDVADRVEQFGVHEWNATRFQVLGHIRNVSLRRALELDCEYYFVCDVDNFIRPCTLRELVALDMPIVAPLLRSISPGQFYSNYHAEVDANGYFKGCDQYHWILNRWVRGVVELPVVHCTYLIRADVIPELTYQDASGRHEYVVFSDSARKAGIPQYFDNRHVYGYITFAEGDGHYVADGIERARALLSADLQARTAAEPSAAWLEPAPPTSIITDRVDPYRTRPKTLIFCTSYATTLEEWEGRYRRWLRAIQASELEYSDILIVDDGSPVLPSWPEAVIQGEQGIRAVCSRPLIHHFKGHLGRKSVFDFPGWYRSFAFAGRYAYAHGYEKVIHIESDAFLIGSRIQRYFNDAAAGWTALWCRRHPFPEMAIQVIAGDAVPRFAAIERTHSHESLIGREFELQLPFDHVEKRFTGDRYGEYLPFVPGNAEYAVQVRSGQKQDYYWWLPVQDAEDAEPLSTAS